MPVRTHAVDRYALKMPDSTKSVKAFRVEPLNHLESWSCKRPFSRRGAHARPKYVFAKRGGISRGLKVSQEFDPPRKDGLPRVGVVEAGREVGGVGVVELHKAVGVGQDGAEVKPVEKVRTGLNVKGFTGRALGFD